MSQIKILPENLANQIAAGEVVERPASVVKELVENAVDAGAHNIAVEIEGAGTGMIRVIDDGLGMDQDDILLSLERHATSKLNCLEQLAAIKTLGFRGEAIPSIASVSKLTITSRTSDAELGNRVEVNCGKIVRVHEMGASPGTVIEVKNLFANLPARRKFLKSAATEIAHIEETVQAYALVNNRAGFSLQVSGRQVFDWLAGGGTTDRRVRQVLGLEEGELLSLAGGVGDYGISVSGYLLSPEHLRTKSAKLWLFVNGRSVKDRMIAHAAAEGLQGFLLKGRRPAGVIFLSLPPELVDVNVHPAKQEVRFRQPNLVHKVVAESVSKGMAAFQQQLKADIFGLSTLPEPPEYNVHDQGIVPAAVVNIPQGKATESEVVHQTSMGHGEVMAEAAVPPYSYKDADLDAKSDDFVSRPQIRCSPGPQPDLKISDPLSDDVVSDAPGPLFVIPEGPDVMPPGISYTGQFMDTYIVFDMGDGIAVIDQHAAQERLLFEELKQAYAGRTMASQILMFPEMVDLSPTEIQILEQYGAEISRLGLEIVNFGGNSFVIKAVPAFIGHVPPLEVLHALIAQFSDSDGADRGDDGRIENVLAGMACKAAIKAGRKLSREEAEHLFCQMNSAGVFSHCPHGRPVVKLFSGLDIKKWFNRA